MRATRLLWLAAAAVCALALGAVLPARADVTPAGPVQPGTAPLTAVSYTPSGDIGRAGGLTWTYSGLTTAVVAQFQTLEWGPTDVEMGMDGALHALNLDVGASNLANGIAVWAGSSTYPFVLNGFPTSQQLDTRLVVTVSGGPWTATSYGGGATVAVTGNYAANLLFEVSPQGANSWTPAKDYFDAHNNVPGNQVVESVTAGFFYVLANTPVASLDATSYDFGDQTVGVASPSHEFTLSNSGTAGLNVSSVSASGDATVSSQTCTQQAVAAGGSCTIDVTITPSAPGASSGTVTVVDDAADSPQTISLTANGVQPALSLGASSLSLDATAVGVTSKAKTLTMTNTGTGALHVSSVTVGGTNAGDFSATPSGCATVQPGSSCQVTVTFSPSATGARSAELTIASDAPSSPDQVALSGTGLDIHVSAAPSPLGYGDVLVGKQKELTLTFTNTGSDPGMITGMPAFAGANPGDFGLDQQSLTCPFGNGGGGPTIPAHGTCSLGIVFTPGGPGTRTATLSIPTNASEGTLSVTVVGNGIHPLVTPTPTSLTFDPQALGTTSAAKDVTVVNTGSTPLSIAAVSSGGDFVADGSACTSGSVAPTQSCAIHVRFKPTAVGPRNGSLEIDSNAASSSDVLSLSGTGIDPTLSAPASVDFGGVVVGQSATQQITIGSTGTTALSIGTVAVAGGGFSIVGDGCSSQTVAAGGSCVVTVRFTPAAGGAATGALTVPSNAPNTPDAVALSGTGLAGTFSASRASLDFDNVLDGTASTKQVTITNIGTGPLTFSGMSVVGPDQTLFSIGAGSTCSSATVLAGGDGCTVQVVFSPVADGAASASLRLSGNVTNAPFSVGLGGSGVSPQLSVSPAGLTFGGQPQGTTSAAQAVTVTSSGTSALDVSSVSATGPFTLAESCASAGPITPGATCTVKVAFAPTAVGAASGVLTVVSDGGTKTVALSGTGTAAADLNVSIGVNTKVAKKNGSLAYTVTVLNAGPSAAAGTTAVDALTSDEEFMSLAAPAGVTCTTPAPGASGTLKCNLGTLATGGSVSFTFYVKVTTRKSTVTDSVSATSQAYDPDPADNQASVTTPVK